jgi:hypothetical protein
MFFYTHVLSQDFALEKTSSYSIATENSELSPTMTSQTANFYSSTGSGQIYRSNTGADNLGGFDSGYAKTSYVFGTAARSVTGRTASSSESTSYLQQFPVTTINNSTSSTFTIGPIGYSTGVDSITYTALGTGTTSFVQEFATIGSSTLSGTASATTTLTGSTRTLTLSNATTLVPLFALAMPTVQRWYEARQNPSAPDAETWRPPGLRAAGIAFAPTHTASSSAVQPLAAGSNRFASDLAFASSSSSSTDGVTAPFDGTAGLTEYSQTGETYFTGSRASSTGWTATGILGATRRRLSGDHFVSGQSISASLTFANSISGAWTSGASVALGLRSASIFTDLKRAGSTAYRWSYQSSSWRLHATSFNSSTSGSYTIAAGLSGAETTATQLAVDINGVTSAILGPESPFTLLSLNELSVSTHYSGTAGASVFYSSANSSSAASASTMTAASSSYTTRLGSASGFAPATYDGSLLSWAVAQVAASIQTATWSSSFEGEGAIPSIFSASKWNEAGRADPVSVIQ